MNWIPSLISGITTFLSVVAAILAWLAKLRWSKEFAAAKDAVITSKEAEIAMLTSSYAAAKEAAGQQISLLTTSYSAAKEATDQHIAHLKSEISSLRELNPEAVVKNFKIIRGELEGQIFDLQKKLDEAKLETVEKDSAIESLKEGSGLTEEKMRSLASEKEHLKVRVDELELELATQREREKFFESLSRTAETLARHDALTNLPNRAALILKGDELDKQHRNYSAAYIDLDRFKQVNDSKGHAIGDKLLQEVGEVLANFAGENTFVARMGGGMSLSFFSSILLSRKRAVPSSSLSKACRRSLNWPENIR